ncbi:MAG TPA: DHA2 family efflux MFS transporter permease subunit [Devosiaceae bacterium]|jgi:EmrB/QacA subfamily drug resistance transporter
MTENHFTPPTDSASADPRRWIALAILLLASFMNLMDVTIVNVAIPSMQANLGAEPSQIEWVVAAFVLAFALGLLPFGRLGDIVGRKRMFLIGVSLFTLGSLLCGIAPNIELLIAARVLQGFAGSVMTPQVLALAQVIFPPKERGLAFSLFGLSAGLASVAGPVIGGALIAGNFWGLDWRPIFLVNIPFGILAVVAGIALIVKVPPHPGLRNDALGIVLFGLAMVLLVYPLIEGRSYGWPWWALAMMLTAVVFAVAFFLWQRHRDRIGASQLLPMALLTNRNFLLGALMTVIFASGVPGFFLTFSIFLQSGFGLTPLQSGLTGVPFSVGVIFASFASGKLGSNFLRQRFAVGCLLLALSMALSHWVIAGITDHVDSLAFLLPLLVGGFGLGIAFGSLFQLILSGVPHKDAGSASGALQAFQQAGGALGVALAGQVFFTVLEGAATTSAGAHGSDFANAAAATTVCEVVTFLVAAAVVLFIRVPRQDQSGRAPAAPMPIEI